jgi:hypothetical protein
MRADVMQLARAESGGGGTVFPDGLAAIINRNLIKETRLAASRLEKRDMAEWSW